ncbi:MAG: aminopeptidase N [Chloroflexota bacterium]
MVAVMGANSARDVLTQDEAATRARQVGDIAYRIDLDLRAGEDAYTGRAIVTFSVRDRSAPLFLEFTGNVTALHIDGRPATAEQRDHRLWLPMDRLGDHVELHIDYRNDYDHSGAGFHRFVDPEDGLEYLHSDFEPFSAHRLFPCFDQPDLKATYELTVDAPEPWHVVTSGVERSVQPLPDGRVRHTYERTLRFSTYVLAVVAGPYAHLTRVHDGIPLGLYGRRSMAHILEREADELFEVTAQGFDLYRQLFGQQYPFGKYDQLFVPEFNAGAMENVAAVTFHDSFLFRDPPTEVQRLERAEVVLHELAHMWFGDLVTLRWWNDLWLNESFATWASFHALERGTRFKDAWTRFNGVMKPAAYRDDQRVTSHPIAMPVPDTDAAQTNFDAIVYEKGASVLRQLMATIGEDAFADGLETYFGRYAWGNATLSDFLGALGRAAGRDLDGWADGWLRTKGTDVVTATWTEADGRIADLAIGVRAPDPDAPSRSHAMEVALVHDVDGRLQVTTLPVLAEGPRTIVPGADGLAVPQLVFPNHGDLDYARVQLDPRSVAFALERINDLDDAQLRQLLWSTLWDMVREAVLPSIDHIDAVMRSLPAEADQELTDSVLEHALAGLGAYVPEPLRAATAGRFIDRALDVVTGSRAIDQQRTWLRAAVAAGADAIGDPALDRLLELSSLPDDGDIPMDQELRWGLAILASAAGRPDAAERIEQESRRDPSDRGVRARITAEVARPDAAGKKAAWERINGAGYGSFQLTRAAMRGFQYPSQRELLLDLRPDVFARLPGTFADREYAFARTWLRLLFPATWGEPEVVAEALRVLDTLGPEDAVLARHLREIVDDMERAIRVRARAAEAAGIA